MNTLVFSVVLGLLLGSAESKSLGKLNCTCEKNGETSKRLDCETICKNDLDQRKCLGKNCERSLSRFQQNPYGHFCKDESTEELYEIGHIWRRNCTILSCDESLKITQREAGCPQGCLIGNNDANKCCSVCQSKLTCTAKEIVIEIPLPLLHGADPVRLGLSDPNCRPIVNSSHVTFRTELSACGTELSKTPNGFKYSNFVQKNPSMSKIVARPWLKFSCFYRSKVSYSHHYQQIPSFRVSLSTLKQNKQITIHYTSEYGDIFEGQSKMRFVKGSLVYVAVFGNKISPDSHYLVLESCILTSLRISNRRQLISKGCPVDPSLKIKHKTFNLVWFSFKANQLTTKYDNYVDLQCQAAICSRNANADICNRKC